MTSPPQARPTATAGWYSAPIAGFLAESVDAVLGALARSSRFSIDISQRTAWLCEIEILRTALKSLDGWLYLEFDVPRLGTRIDAVVLIGSAIIPIEFKVGEREYRRVDIEQAWDYALDLKNFHEASHNADIFPLLVATEADANDAGWPPPHPDGVRPPRKCNAASLADVLEHGSASASGRPIDGRAWGRAQYRPTPTIVQAARALYSRHSVEEISRNDAGATNLRITSHRVEEVIDEANTSKAKAIVFVTGVPGAGKTLVGLDIATRRRGEGSTHAVYLSGNGPLVDVLREALTRDEIARFKGIGSPKRKGEVAQPIKQFIQNVHHFRDAGLQDGAHPPADHVVIFDESQRAWSREKTEKFMRVRKNRPGFSQSEPEFLLAYMDRHPDWAVVVCLVGGGQEIHTGEAGIGAWLDAARTAFPDWRVYLSPNLTDAEYAATDAIAALEHEARLHFEAGLHLSVSMRSFRAEKVSNFVKSVLDHEVDEARQLLHAVRPRYPVAITRDLSRARSWVRGHARGSERYGLVASSQAERLKPHAIDVRVKVDPVHYFLADANDTRSSYYLEDAATEFQIQGLELDWICVNWDADLRHTGQGWSHHAFRGDRWTDIHKADRQQYLLNAYRVLLTRARQGMVIFVPPGEPADPTRRPEFYDGTFEYLVGLGLDVLV
jgi:Schlafen group 3, DNA/RNA helicase domain